MKYSILAATAITLAGCSTTSPTQVDTSSSRDITSYTFGYEAGNSAEQGLERQRLDRALFLLGVQDAMRDRAPRHNLNEEEVAHALEEHAEWAAMVTEEEIRITSEENAVEGAKFRDEYARSEGVKRLDEDILYTVLVNGNGDQQPSTSDTVEVHYEGSLPDGTVFDSSIERGTPVAVDLTRVIAGWQKAISHMTEGDVWEVVLPPNQAYGENGRAPAVGPNQTLIFKIELISVI
ncbi:MAG: FKBP-type peptidyl-prolyl cis-trans isomerase [Alcanivorax sp.]|nr:FKBP-type peptidyl-prolyl cis-trans isomerase [Alcanivorax sp.]